MKHEGTIALFHYWNRLRGERPAPRRTEIEPADIKSLLADTFILENDSRGEAVFRLAGTRLCATYGREMKGYSFISLWGHRDQRVIARFTYAAFHNKSVVTVALEGASLSGRINKFEMILLPLEGGMGSPRILGAITPLARPYWLGADPIIESRIDTLRVIDADREPELLAARTSVTVPPIDPAEAQMLPIQPEPSKPGRRVRHLVVIDGGREG